MHDNYDNDPFNRQTMTCESNDLITNLNIMIMIMSQTDNDVRGKLFGPWSVPQWLLLLHDSGFYHHCHDNDDCHDDDDHDDDDCHDMMIMMMMIVMMMMIMMMMVLMMIMMMMMTIPFCSTREACVTTPTLPTMSLSHPYSGRHSPRPSYSSSYSSSYSYLTIVIMITKTWTIFILKIYFQSDGSDLPHTTGHVHSLRVPEVSIISLIIIMLLCSPCESHDVTM